MAGLLLLNYFCFLFSTEWLQIGSTVAIFVHHASETYLIYHLNLKITIKAGNVGKNGQ